MTIQMERFLKLFTIFSILPFLLATPEQFKDPCERLFYASRDNNTTPAQVLSCYKLFPYDSVIAAKTLKVFTNVLDFYAFYDISQDVPEPKFQPNVFAKPILERLEKDIFKNDWEFQRKLTRALTAYNDGHLWYYSNCYTQFEFLQPFFIAAIWDRLNKENRVFIPSMDARLGNITLKTTMQNFTGAEVLEINGVPALKYLQAFADREIGVSKDPTTRLQLALSFRSWDAESQSFKIHHGGFTYRSEVPDGDHVEYTIQLPGPGAELKKVRIPWIGRPVNSTLSWIDQNDYWRVHCQPKGENAIDSIRPRKKHQQQRKTKPFQRFMKKTPSDFVRSLGKQEMPELVINQTGISIHLIRSEKTAELIAVLSMSEFPMATEEWKQKVLEGLQRVKKQGARKLLLNMANNGGGYLCTYHLMLKLLTPRDFHPFVTDMRLSPGLKKLVSTAFEGNYTDSAWLPTWWVEAKSGKLFNDSSVLEPRDRILPHGKADVSSSQQFYEYCDGEWSDGVEFAAKDMAVLTNGFCGSSCALFVNHLREQSGVRTVAISLNDQPSTFFSFPGSEVYDTDSIIEDVRAVGLSNEPGLNFRFPSRATMSFPFRQAWSHDGKVMEYHAVYADEHLAWTKENVLQPVQLWREVARKLWKIK